MNDMETCSWCLVEVEDDTLTEVVDGARICDECFTDEAIACDVCGDRTSPEGITESRSGLLKCEVCVADW